jgi:hypothetical protein
MVSATLQTPQYPILLLPWLCFRVAALQTEGFGAGHAPAPLACTPPSRFPCLRIHPPPPRAIALSSPRPFAVPPVRNKEAAASGSLSTHVSGLAGCTAPFLYVPLQGGDDVQGILITMATHSTASHTSSSTAMKIIAPMSCGSRTRAKTLSVPFISRGPVDDKKKEE